MSIANLVIIGSGPAGYTAALYAGRAQLQPIVFAGFMAGGVPGGQLMTTTDVENFPGFPDAIQGPDLMQRMRQQALRWGAEVIDDDVVQVSFQQRPFSISTADRVIYTYAIIICTGATAKRLHLPGEETFWNNGISACAICDGANPLFRNAEVAVVGGGDSAAEEALYLTKYACMVHLLVRRDRLRASKTLQARLLNHPKIRIHWQSSPISAHGDDVLRWLQVQHTPSGTISKLPVRGLFYAIGHTPNTQLFQGQLALDPLGYIQTQGKSTATNIPGVWAAGDVQDPYYRQAITAAASGCMAALEAERWLSEYLPHWLPPVPSVA
ncbi:thioredoxin-disulfide reductase [Trichothermofontia sp.]